jgi:antitoxin VapB
MKCQDSFLWARGRFYKDDHSSYRETSGRRFSVDIYYGYIPLLEVAMGKNGIAKLFRNGRSQAVRLPQEFRFEGDRVRIRRIDHGVILEPMIPDAAKWFDEMDRFNQEQFMGKRRDQPITPSRKIFK